MRRRGRGEKGRRHEGSIEEKREWEKKRRREADDNTLFFELVYSKHDSC